MLAWHSMFSTIYLLIVIVLEVPSGFRISSWVIGLLYHIIQVAICLQYYYASVAGLERRRNERRYLPNLPPETRDRSHGSICSYWSYINALIWSGRAPPYLMALYGLLPLIIDILIRLKCYVLEGIAYSFVFLTIPYIWFIYLPARLWFWKFKSRNASFRERKIEQDTRIQIAREVLKYWNDANPGINCLGKLASELRRSSSKEVLIEHLNHRLGIDIRNQPFFIRDIRIALARLRLDIREKELLEDGSLIVFKRIYLVCRRHPKRMFLLLFTVIAFALPMRHCPSRANPFPSPWAFIFS